MLWALLLLLIYALYLSASCRYFSSDKKGLIKGFSPLHFCLYICSLAITITVSNISVVMYCGLVPKITTSFGIFSRGIEGQFIVISFSSF